MDSINTSDLELIRGITTIEEARALLANAIRSTKLQTMAENKISQIGKQMINDAKDINQAREVYRRVFFCERLSARSMQKIIELSGSIEECLKIYEEAKYDSVLRKIALEKISEHYDDQLSKAKVFHDAKRIYENAPKGTQIKARALSEMLNLAVNLDQTKEVYSRAFSRGELKKRALTKMRNLAKSDIKKATSICQVVRICKKVPMNKSLEKLAAKRITELE